MGFLHFSPHVYMNARAIAVFDGIIKGTVKFFDNDYDQFVAIEINLTGLKQNSLHGFHIHEYGDLTNLGDNACTHYNPYGKNHGCPGAKERHVGDLGNIQTDSYGNANYISVDNIIKLRGKKCNIIGRCLVIHAEPDDCGMGGDEESLKTGNAGFPIACAVIGIASPVYRINQTIPFIHNF